MKLLDLGFTAVQFRVPYSLCRLEGLCSLVIFIELCCTAVFRILYFMFHILCSVIPIFVGRYVFMYS